MVVEAVEVEEVRMSLRLVVVEEGRAAVRHWLMVEVELVLHWRVVMVEAAEQSRS